MCSDCGIIYMLSRGNLRLRQYLSVCYIWLVYHSHSSSVYLFFLSSFWLGWKSLWLFILMMTKTRFHVNQTFFIISITNNESEFLLLFSLCASTSEIHRKAEKTQNKKRNHKNWGKKKFYNSRENSACETHPKYDDEILFMFSRWMFLICWESKKRGNVMLREERMEGC